MRSSPDIQYSDGWIDGARTLRCAPSSLCMHGCPGWAPPVVAGNSATTPAAYSTIAHKIVVWFLKSYMICLDLEMQCFYGYSTHDYYYYLKKETHEKNQL
jgi:hypothetical protein